MRQSRFIFFFGALFVLSMSAYAEDEKESNRVGDLYKELSAGFESIALDRTARLKDNSIDETFAEGTQIYLWRFFGNISSHGIYMYSQGGNWRLWYLPAEESEPVKSRVKSAEQLKLHEIDAAIKQLEGLDRKQLLKGYSEESIVLLFLKLRPGKDKQRVIVVSSKDLDNESQQSVRALRDKLSAIMKRYFK